MKFVKTGNKNSLDLKKGIVMTMVFLVSILSTNAQIGKPINKQLDLDKISPNSRSDLKLKKSGLTVVVHNNDRKNAIPYAKVILEKQGGKRRQNLVADKNGICKVELSPGKYLMYVVKPGYISWVSHPVFVVVSLAKWNSVYIDLDKE